MPPNEITPPVVSPNTQPSSPIGEQVNRDQNSEKKPRLPRLVKIFSWIFWVPSILITILVAYLTYEASHGVSGTEYFGLLIAPIALVLVVIGIVYLALLVIYVFSKYPTKRQRLICAAAIFVLIGLYSWQITISIKEANKINQSKKLLADSEVISLIDNCKVESIQKNGDKVDLLLVSDAYYDSNGNYLWRSTTASSANFNSFVDEVNKIKSKCGGDVSAIDNMSGPNVSYVSVQQATELLQQCKVKTFNYTPSGLGGLEVKPSSGTDTGIIWEEYPTFGHLFVETSAEANMVPIARKVQQTCGGPQFYHDGRYEQRGPDGTWH